MDTKEAILAMIDGEAVYNVHAPNEHIEFSSGYFVSNNLVTGKCKKYDFNLLGRYEKVSEKSIEDMATRELMHKLKDGEFDYAEFNVNKKININILRKLLSFEKHIFNKENENDRKNYTTITK